MYFFPQNQTYVELKKKEPYLLFETVQLGMLFFLYDSNDIKNYLSVQNFFLRVVA